MPKELTMASPFQQFEIVPLTPAVEVAGASLSFTNSALAMIASAAVASLFMGLGMRRRALVPGHWQMMVESCHRFVANMVRDNAGDGSEKFVPFVLSIFLFILCGNLLGMLPSSFTFTSHIAVTFAMAAIAFVGVTLVGFFYHGIGFLRLFVPQGVPLLMLPLMVVIEIISYLSRPVSLSVRLFANMMAGHVMLKIFVGFVAAMGVWGFLPFGISVALNLFELFVAFLQAYVFAILCSIYLHDALHLH